MTFLKSFERDSLPVLVVMRYPLILMHQDIQTHSLLTWNDGIEGKGAGENKHVADFVKKIQTNITRAEWMEQVAHEDTSVPTAELFRRILGLKELQLVGWSCNQEKAWTTHRQTANKSSDTDLGQGMWLYSESQQAKKMVG